MNGGSIFLSLSLLVFASHFSKSKLFWIEEKQIVYVNVLRERIYQWRKTKSRVVYENLEREVLVVECSDNGKMSEE